MMMRMGDGNGVVWPGINVSLPVAAPTNGLSRKTVKPDTVDGVETKYQRQKVIN